MKWVVFSLALAGCAAAAPAAQVTSPAADPSAGNAERFHRDEAALLLALSTIDARLALRIGTNPSEAELSKTAMSAVLAGDSSLVVHEGALDVFSFESRARGLDAAAKSADGWTYPLSDDAKLERDLVKRLIAEEKARLSEEKKLPASASELVRGLVLTWSEAPVPEALKGKDGWLARRVDDVRESLKDDVLTTVQLNELDDALDPLERLTIGYTGTAAALARLRIALGQAHPSQAPLATWTEIQNAAFAHLGVKLDLEATRTALETVKGALREEITRKKKLLSPQEARALEADAEKLVFVEDHCKATTGVRALGPPPERAPICGLVKAMAAGDAGSLALLMALHDDTTVALWVLGIYGDRLDPKRATEKHRFESGIPPEREVRLLRRAVVRPLSALGLGWAVTLLVRENEPRSSLHFLAERWLVFGDAPLDVIGAELQRAK